MTDAVSAVTLPVNVEFTVGTQRDHWSQRLTQYGQELASSANRDDRQFPIILPWQDAEEEREGEPECSDPRWPKHARLKGVTLFTPDDQSYQIDIGGCHKRWGDRVGERNHLRIGRPGLVANDALTYRYWGSYQAFARDTVVLKNGAFALGSPSDSFLEWWVGARTSFGFTLGDLQARPLGELELALQWRKYNNGFVLEVPFAYSIGLREYDPVRASENDASSRGLLLNRVQLGLRLLGCIAERYCLGGAAALGWQWAADLAQEDFVGLDGFSARPEFIFRFVATRALHFQTLLRGVFPEFVRNFGAGPDSSTTYVDKNYFSMTVLVGVGLTAPL